MMLKKSLLFFILAMGVAFFSFSGCGTSDSGDESDGGPSGGSGNGRSTPSNLNEPGWTEPTPTTYDTSTFSLADLEQPGSRIFYISSSGNDDTAEIYFWDETQIVDSSGSSTGTGGVAYGTDPFNPTGPVIPFQKWPCVAPRRYAWQDIRTTWDGAGDTAPGHVESVTRYEFPDWWLFKRGDTFDLNQDYLSYALETNSGVTEVTAGSLAVSGGRSVTERQVVGAYGDLSQERPKFINPPGASFIRRWTTPDPKHIIYLSLHFDGRGARRGSGIDFLFQGTDAVDILLEDCWIDGTQGNFIQDTSIWITLRRCVVTDSWRDDGEHLQGLFFGGTRDARLRIEECIFMRNGFSAGDPAVTGWPPSGSQIYDVFNRNFYLSGECNNMESGVFDTISLIGASGDQCRAGMRIERNFLYQGYMSLGGHGGYPDAEGPNGTILDNVLQRFIGSGTNDDRGQPGWGIELTSGAYAVEVARNIVIDADDATDFNAFTLAPLSWYCYHDIFAYPTRDNDIHDNIFDGKNAPAAARVLDGVTAGNEVCSNWSDPGVTDNTFTNNFLFNSGGIGWEYVSEVSDDNVDDTNTTFSGNTVYFNRGDAATGEGWLDPYRSLEIILKI